MNNTHHNEHDIQDQNMSVIGLSTSSSSPPAQLSDPSDSNISIYINILLHASHLYKIQDQNMSVTDLSSSASPALLSDPSDSKIKYPCLYI
jgi:hypothetical protein